MRTINLKESLIRIDQETDFKYTLTDLYEACRLDEKKKRNLSNLIKEYDHAGMDAKLSNASQMSSMLTDASGIMTENISDDIPDDEMLELEGWSPDMSECPACGDFTFNSKRGRCNACYYVEQLTESFAEGDMVYVKPSKKSGRVVRVKGDTVEVEIMGVEDPDRRDTFYASDLEKEEKMEESGALAAIGAAAATGFGQAVGDKVATKLLGEDAEQLDFSCYNLTDEQIDKVKYIRQHLNTPEGYKAYYELEKEITDEGGCMDIFYDLSADFAWDNRFSVALTRLALADNRPDLADPNYLPGGCYYQYMEDPKYANVLLEDTNKPDLESTLRAAAEPKLRDMDYDDDFINEYFGINLEDTEDNRIKVTVWGELYYEELDELADVLNHIVAEEDPEAYFDHETSGRIVAYIRKDQTEDIPDEALVNEWSEKFNGCKTWEELKSVYGEFYHIRDDLNNGTHRALYDIIDKKIDELKPVEESLTEDAEEVPAAIYSMLDAADKYVDNDDYPEGASEEEIIEIAKNNPDCMKVTKWVDGQTGPDEVVWEREVDTWFICQYEGGAEYEHAEGGYYYETLTFVDKETFPSKAEAQKRLAELAAEAEQEGQEVVAVTNDFFRIKTGKYIGDCEEYHVEAKEGAHASGKKVYEGLNEAILSEINSPEEKPYSAAEIKKEIKSLTQNFTREKDNLKCGFKEENDAAVKELKKHYAKVTSEKRGEWFEITFSGLKKNLKEAVTNEPVKLASEYFYDTVKNIQDAGWSDVLSFAEDSGWIRGNQIIIPAGTVMTLVDDNRHFNVYWVKTNAGDEFIPFNKDFTAESPLSFEDPAAEGANAYNVTFYMDSLDDNVMSGPHTTKKIYANSEEEAKKKLMDSSTDKYYIPTIVKVELVESNKLREGTKQKRIACTTEFDNGNVIHNDWQEISDEEAEELAKQRSIENPDKVYYVKYDDIMNPCSDYKWKNGQCVKEAIEMTVDESKSIKEAMTYTDTNGFLGEPGETYTMSQFRRMWQDKDNDPVMSGYDSFEEWVGETISQMDAHEEGVAPSGRGKLSCATFTDKSGIMGTAGEKYTVNDLADYWEANRGSDPVLAKYKGNWKAWLDDTIEQMEVSYDSSLFEESLTESKSELDKLNTILAAQGDELRRLKKDGASQSEIDKIVKDIEGTKKKIAVLCESFEDMLKDPEVQRRNAEYADRMKAKHDKENELAKEAKSWPDDKVLNYEEALALAKAYYNQGGDGFYETIEKYQFDDEVKMFGPMTVGQMKRDFGVFDSVAKDRMGDDVL